MDSMLPQRSAATTLGYGSGEKTFNISFCFLLGDSAASRKVASGYKHLMQVLKVLNQVKSIYKAQNIFKK